MIFTYFKKTGELRDRLGEWDGDEGFEFEYEVNNNDLLEAVCVLADEHYFDCKDDLKKLRNFIFDFDLIDILVESFKDELHDYFEEKALDSLD